jgi:hypothetical protein
MPPSSPYDLIWRALAPLLQSLETLDRVLQVSATYYVWFAGSAAGVAILLLGGLVIAESTGDGDGPSFMATVSSPIRKWIDEHLGGVSRGSSEASPMEQ